MKGVARFRGRSKSIRRELTADSGTVHTVRSVDILKIQTAALLIHSSSATVCSAPWVRHRIPTVVDLRKIKLRLMAYSLWYDQSAMTDWNFEGNEDGEEWTVLHESRNEQHLPTLYAVSIMPSLATQLRHAGIDDEMENDAIAQAFAQRLLRHTWNITLLSTDAFYGYFRNHWSWS